LTELIAESTSIFSIINCSHRIYLKNGYYRRGNQIGNFSPESLHKAIREIR
jgi:hypothetical protein